MREYWELINVKGGIYDVENSIVERIERRKSCFFEKINGRD